MKKTLLALVLPALLAGCNPSDNDSQPPAPAAQAHEFLVQLGLVAQIGELSSQVVI
ncbi:lipoprotein [Aeromonas sp. QDB08]|uniref:lipoprotein n=1 Tax=Aeromonas sp. QDB08 TaxID=2990480 RepID=UPI0022E0276E|nr:lipoprotein [Aeromonas sp. QDB08]